MFLISTVRLGICPKCRAKDHRPGVDLEWKRARKRSHHAFLCFKHLKKMLEGISNLQGSNALTEAINRWEKLDLKPFDISGFLESYLSESGQRKRE